MAKPIPDGMTSITPYLTVPGVARLIEFLEQAFDGKVEERMEGPGGAVMHAQVRIRGSVVMMGEASDHWKAMPSQIYLYVEDMDNLYARAMAAGGTSIREPFDEFYGDRVGAVKDPSGNIWWMATHTEDVAHEEMMRRMKAARG
jgi:PhnB protein